MSFVTDTLFGKKSKPQVQQSGLRELIEIFPQLKDVGADIIGRGTELAGGQDIFTPSQIAQLSELERQGLSGLAAAGSNLPSSFTPSLISDTQPFRPKFRFGQRASEAFDQSSQAFGRVAPVLDQATQAFGRVAPTLDRATGFISSGVSPITGQQIQTGISQFMNPFESDVVANVAREAQEAGRGLLSDIAGEATGAGAFGGERQALLEAQVPELVAQQVGDVSAQLRRAGFESSAGRALQNLMGERQRSLQGGGLTIQQAGEFGNLGRGLTGVASGFTGLGTQLGGLGSRLFDARQGVQNIQSQQLADQISRLGAQTGLAQTRAGIAGQQVRAGQLPRQIEQAGLQRQTQIGQIPLNQLALLQGVLGGFPSSGAGRGAQAGTAGLFGTGGNIGQGIGNLAGLFF